MFRNVTYLCNRVEKWKDNLEIFDNGRQIRYDSRNVYYFQPDRSEGLDPMTDTFINVNLPVLVSKYVKKTIIPFITYDFKAIFGQIVLISFKVLGYFILVLQTFLLSTLRRFSVMQYVLSEQIEPFSD